MGGTTPEVGGGRCQTASQDPGGEILLRHGPLSYSEVTWAEDRATRGRDPSADPGAKTGMGGTMPPLGFPRLARMR